MGKEKVYCNVAENKLLDGGKVVEDVTQVGLPTLSHPSTNVNGSGMAMAIDVPDMTKFEAMELTITHNNGLNGKLLQKPGVHNIEFRIARQKYDVVKANLGFEGMKVRVRCIHKQTQKGNIENGSPYGSTDTFSIVRYEEEQNGKQVVLIDATTNDIIINGVKYSDKVANLLN